MTLYEIDEKIVNGIKIDPETGEVLNADEIDALQMERDAKIENIALWIKDLKAESDALKGEIDVLTERKKVTDNKVKSLSSYLNGYLKNFFCVVFLRRFQTYSLCIITKKWYGGQYVNNIFNKLFRVLS